MSSNSIEVQSNSVDVREHPDVMARFTYTDERTDMDTVIGLDVWVGHAGICLGPEDSHFELTLMLTPSDAVALASRLIRAAKREIAITQSRISEIPAINGWGEV